MKTNPQSSKKVVIAHRGASGYLPEHTLESKKLAFDMGADYLEQDLVLSKDDVPVVIHDIYLDEVTDVALKYPERKRKNGRYYVIDFTYEELKLLEVKERFDHKTGEQIYPNRYRGDDLFRLHSFAEEIEYIQALNKAYEKKVGIYPEIKKPDFHRNNGKDISKIVLKILSDYGYLTKDDPCILQCFNAKELERIRKELKSELFLVQLIDHPSQTLQLNNFATYADGIGPWYPFILSEIVDQKHSFTTLVKDAHELGLVVHPYTLRADDLREFDSFELMVKVLLKEANADGAFTDHPDQMTKYLK